MNRTSICYRPQYGYRVNMLKSLQEIHVTGESDLLKVCYRPPPPTLPRKWARFRLPDFNIDHDFIHSCILKTLTLLMYYNVCNKPGNGGAFFHGVVGGGGGSLILVGSPRWGKINTGISSCSVHTMTICFYKCNTIHP